MTRVWKKLKSNKLNSEESGYILIMSLFVLIILFLIGTTLAVLGIQEFNLSARTKLMDQAYAIADAGVNRAAVALQMDSNLSKTTTPGPYPTAQAGPFPENFGGGTFTWTLYQSEAMLNNPSYKVIRSTGTISKSGRTAERTIETRIIAGAGGDEYDASFDYLFYNGNSDTVAPAIPPVWPTQRGLGGIISGNYTWDGFTAYKGRSPRGAVYTKGSIEIPVFLLGGILIKGNVVATDNITLQNTWNATWSQPGITIDNNGKVIAGLDGSGSATVRLIATNGGITSQMQINGQVIAYNDVTIEATANAALWDSALTINGIKAGNDVSFSGTANIGKKLQLGTIIAGRRVSIKSRWATGVVANTIWAGQDLGNGEGVFLQTTWAGSITASNVTSRGKVTADSTVASITLGTIVAGNDVAGATGGTGINFTMNGLAGCSTGGLTATGNIYFSGSYGGNLNCGNIWSGGNIDLKTGELWLANDKITTGNISAKGYFDLNAGDRVTLGNVTAEDYVYIRSNDDIFTRNVYSNSWEHVETDWWIGDLSENQFIIKGAMIARGDIYLEGTANPFDSDFGNDPDDPPYNWNDHSYLVSGAWGNNVTINRRDLADITDTDAHIGTLPGYGSQSIRANGNISVDGAGDILWGTDVYMSDYMAGGSCWFSGDTDEGSRIGGNPGLPNPVSVSIPTKPDPVYVDRNGVLDEPGPQGQNKNVDVLVEANLDSTVNLLEPNWDYFETMATEDDASNPAAPHMVYDGGPGDNDGAVDGNIELLWDTSKPYSNRETIYNGDPSVSIDIKALNWSNYGAEFTATIVSQGHVHISVTAQSAWSLQQKDVLNIVSGKDINCVTPFTLSVWNTIDNEFHFWADHDVNLQNMAFSLGGNQFYYGSFTAGNRVYMADNSFWPDSTFRWSRWALDPVAWAPPFQVLTWKEI